MRGDNLFSDEITHTELIELDNDLKVMRHKADYMQEKLYKETQAEKEQVQKVEQLRH